MFCSEGVLPSLSQPIMSSSIRQKQGTTSSAMNDEVSTPKASEMAIGVNIIVEIDSLINNGIRRWLNLKII